MKELTNIYKPVRAEILQVIEESPLIKTFVLKLEKEFSFHAGEFVELTLNGYGEAPFTPSSSPLIKDRVEITVMKTGYLTEKLHTIQTGDVLGLRGPFGRGYPIESFLNKEILILGGGCGLAPIRSLLYMLMTMTEKIEKVMLCYGSKTPSDCIYKHLFSELCKMDKFETYRTVDEADDEWKESEGVVTVLLDKMKVNIKNTVAVVCGPVVMMKAGVERLMEIGFAPKDIYLSLEKNMSCGVGKCGHCMMGEYFVCKDGPVFSYEELIKAQYNWM